MRLAQVVLLLPMALAAQTPPGAGLIRGTLLEREVESGGGEFSVRTASHEVFRFKFDGKTWFERESEHIEAGSLRPGEIVEVVADANPSSLLRYARTVHVIQPPAPARPTLSAGRVRAYRSPIEHIVPTGTMTFSGVIFRISAEQITLHTRAGGEQTILLRRDTRYLDGGNMVDVAALKPNTRVFVRAGKDLYGEVEAYQVIWGTILQPNQP
jgi:hypothetical protein